MRPINADALCEYFAQAFKKNRFVSLTYSEYMDAVRASPTIDPVRRSHWNGWTTTAYMGRQDELGDPIFADRRFFRCDNCRHGSAIKHKHCPNCGARMEGDPK